MEPVILSTKRGLQLSFPRKGETVKAERGQNFPQENQRKLILTTKSLCLMLMDLPLLVARKLMTRAGFLCNTYNEQNLREVKAVVQSREANGYYHIFHANFMITCHNIDTRR